MKTSSHVAWLTTFALFICALLAQRSLAEAPANCSTPTETDRGVHAVYLGRYDEELPRAVDSVLSLCYVTGITIYVSWSELEPREGKFNWSLLDEALEIAQKHKRKISFGLNVATYSPDWVRSGAATFTYTHINPNIGRRVAPVPWDPFYIARLTDTVRAIGRRYDGNASILFVVIDGPATLWGTETNWALQPGSVNAADQIKLGFSLERYEIYWKKMIDIFFATFPKTDLALALNDEIASPDSAGSKFATVSAIRDYALEKARTNGHRKRLWLELLGLTSGRRGRVQFTDPEKTGRRLTPYVRLAWDKRNEASLDYQASVVFRTQRPPYSAREVGKALKLGSDLGADIIEVKVWDLINIKSGAPYAPYASTVMEANERLMLPAKAK